MTEKVAFEVGSGNVFEDLELPSAKERLEKAMLMSRIHDILIENNIDKKTLAPLLSLDEKAVVDMLCGRLDNLSVEKLNTFLDVLEAYA